MLFLVVRPFVKMVPVFMLFIVPKFKEMFNEMGDADLPKISQIVFGFSEFMLNRAYFVPNAVWLLIALGLIWFVLQMWSRTKAGRRILDTTKLKMPLFGDIQRKSAIARFSRTLGTQATAVWRATSLAIQA